MALKGNNGDNDFDCTIFNDEVFGFGGNDHIQGSPGSDRIDGGGDRDRVDYSHFLGGIIFGSLFIEGDAVDVDLERGIQFGGLAEGDVLIDIEDILGSSFNDTIRGDAEANGLNGFSGNDTVDGRGGDDVLIGDDGNDTLTGGLGNDQLLGGDGNDTLFGDPGFDRLDGGAGVDTANYIASAAAVTVFLNAGIGAGSGDAGGDILFNIENVTGSTFNDSLFGSAAANVLAGGFGNDLLAGAGGADTLNGGNGFDTASYAGSGSAITIDLAHGSAAGGDAAGDTLIAIENLTGSSFNDVLFGNAVTNILDGGGGADTLKGAGGADTLIGAVGIDTLVGGSGADRFVWRDVGDSGLSIPTMDLIVDFDPLAGDLIDLGGIDADVFTAGNQAFTFIGAAAFSNTPGEVNFVQVNGETIIQLQTGVSGDIEMGIRIAGLVTPEASWFVL